MKKVITALSVMVFSLCVLSCGNKKSDENNSLQNQDKGEFVRMPNEAEGYIEEGDWVN